MRCLLKIYFMYNFMIIIICVEIFLRCGSLRFVGCIWILVFWIKELFCCRIVVWYLIVVDCILYVYIVVFLFLCWKISNNIKYCIIIILGFLRLNLYILNLIWYILILKVNFFLWFIVVFFYYMFMGNIKVRGFYCFRGLK